MTISVLLADDQEMVRTGLQHMIAAADGLEVVGVAENGREALELARRLRPDVCLLDIRMPEMTGLEVTRHLATDPDPPKIVIVTTYDLEEYLLQALQGGASGFVLKDASAAVLISAIRAAAEGDALISPRLTRRLITTYLHRQPDPGITMPHFTRREVEVLAALCDGATNDEIGDRLHMATSTVKGHVGALMHKTATTNRVKLAIWAFRMGVLPDGPESARPT